MLGKLRLLFWIGIVLLFMPFFGIPTLWKTILTVVIGVVVTAIVFRLRYAYKKIKFEMRQVIPPEESNG